MQKVPLHPSKTFKNKGNICPRESTNNSIYQIEFARMVRLEVVCVRCPCAGTSLRRERPCDISATERGAARLRSSKPPPLQRNPPAVPLSRRGILGTAGTTLRGHPRGGDGVMWASRPTIKRRNNQTRSKKRKTRATSEQTSLEACLCK